MSPYLDPWSGRANSSTPRKALLVRVWAGRYREFDGSIRGRTEQARAGRSQGPNDDDSGEVDNRACEEWGARSQEAVRRRSKTSRQVGSPLGEPSVEIKTQQERITRGRRSGPALHGLLNLLFYELLDSLRCLKATAVAFIKGRR